MNQDLHFAAGLRRAVSRCVVTLFALIFLGIAQPVLAADTSPGGNEASGQPDARVRVLGWHRAASGFAEHDYSVIDMLAWFHYIVDPATGANKSADDWAKDAVVDAALEQGSELYLTITNFGFDNNSTFLNNAAAVDALIDAVTRLLIARKGQGVCVDFEEIHSRDQDAFNAFIRKLSTALAKNDLSVLVVLPIYYPENVVDPKELAGLVDYYVMLGYASYHLHSSHAGPMSPWQSGHLWNPYSLERNVDQYLQNGFAPTQFMVALPLYGTIWQTVSHDVPARSNKGLEQPPYDSIHKHFEGQVPVVEPVSGSSYFSYKEKGEFRQCWFESQENLVRKIDLLLDKNLAGIAFWTLDYATEHPGLWTALGQAVRRPRTLP